VTLKEVAGESEVKESWGGGIRRYEWIGKGKESTMEVMDECGRGRAYEG